MRRSALLGVAGSALTAIAPFFGNRTIGILPAAFAQGSPGVGPGMGSLVHIQHGAAASVPMAEWEGVLGAAETGTRSNRVASGTEAVDKAPAAASRYSAQTFQFPSGALRILTFKKGGGPVFHQITFETEIYLLRGTLTLSPLRGLKGESVKVSAGDALYLPSGTLTNPKPSEDTILLLAQVASASTGVKSAIVRGRDVVETHTAQWQEGGKEFTATTPQDLKRAPASAARWSTKRYVFDGNSIRVASFRKGGKTNVGTTSRTDVLIHIVKGRFRRTEGDQVFEAAAGDCLREKLGNPGFWEVLEDSVFVATDAPVNPGLFAPSIVAR